MELSFPPATAQVGDGFEHGQSYLFGDSRSAPFSASFEEERQEVFDSLREQMGFRRSDPDFHAACSYLLRHLARTPARY
ncbi:MAG TPA: hypothetical protein VG675_21900 [Bryobacteraceae bacterium]|nr:hypothetical protein [Bryobacteraceae bacterium]